MLVIKESPVKRQGNGVSVYIPSKIRDILEVGEGDKIIFVAEDKKVVITKK